MHLVNVLGYGQGQSQIKHHFIFFWKSKQNSTKR